MEETRDVAQESRRILAVEGLECLAILRSNLVHEEHVAVRHGDASLDHLPQGSRG